MLTSQHESEAAERFGEVRAEFDGFSKMLFRPRMVAHAVQSDTKTVMRLWIVGLAYQSGLEALARFGDPPLLTEHDTEVLDRLRVVWLQRKGLSETRRCLLELSLGSERKAEVVVV